MSVISTIEQLEAIYGVPNDASTVKVADRVTPAYRALMDKSPFAALATCGPEGLDCSPRGDCPASYASTTRNPADAGSPRQQPRDSLRNIVRDPRVALLFLIPGSGSTLRINGRAQVSVEPELCASFKMDDKPPRTVIVIAVEEVYFQCARAIVRADLESRQAGRSQNPADARPDTGRDERQRGGWRKIRSGMAGARAADDVVIEAIP